MKHGKLNDNHNKEDNATRFSDISTPVKLGKPRGFSRCVKSFVLRARVFVRKTFCIDRSFYASRFKIRCSGPLELLQLWLPRHKIAGWYSPLRLFL